MATRSTGSILGLNWFPATIAVVLTGSGWSAEPRQDAAVPHVSSEALVRAALEKEVVGDNSQREAYLRQALYDWPKDAAAHWQLGQVRIRGKWQSPAEIEHAARDDKRLAEYTRRRDAAGPSITDQAALARWCRKNQLDDQQRVHWIPVLQLQPDNAEAMQALGLRPHRGILLTPRQIEQLRAQLHKVRQAADRWSPLLARWQTAAERGDAALTPDIRERLAKISDPFEMLGLEQTMWLQVRDKRKQSVYHAMVLAMMPVLGENPRPAAGESLARHAVFSTFNDVRAAAIAGLKRHPLDHYAPLLLSGLQSPIKAGAAVRNFGPGELGYSCSLYQEGALVDLSFSYDLFFTFVNQFDDGSVALPTDRASAARANATYNELTQMAGRLTSSVERANEGFRLLNSRIAAALRQLTGLDLGNEPMQWWTWWWQDYNEMYKVSSGGESADPYEPPKPVYDYHSWGEYYIRFPCSCFAPGTKVWTLTGGQAIEKIKAGDCVLAQDVESGELAYKPVLAVTVRQPGPRIRVGLGSESIVATPSHPFWVLGQGWRMTKQLAVGSRVHTPSGGVTIESIEKFDPDPAFATGVAYNLIVADFNSYFVGDHGILVHDNTPRMPTAALVPGLLRSAP